MCPPPQLLISSRPCKRLTTRYNKMEIQIRDKLKTRQKGKQILTLESIFVKSATLTVLHTIEIIEDENNL